jgi:predicted nucleic acid-binding protein
VSGYVLDDLVLIAGMAATGKEHHRRELSRLLHGAIDGGPEIKIPALCLAAAAALRPAIADHIADILAAAPAGAIDVCGLTRTAHLDALLALRPGLGWPATHAAAHALAAGLPVLTVDPNRYTGVGLDVLPL